MVFYVFKKRQFWVVISVLKERQSWLVTRVVTKGKL